MVDRHDEDGDWTTDGGDETAGKNGRNQSPTVLKLYLVRDGQIVLAPTTNDRRVVRPLRVALQGYLGVPVYMKWNAEAGEDVIDGEVIDVPGFHIMAQCGTGSRAEAIQRLYWLPAATIQPSGLPGVFRRTVKIPATPNSVILELDDPGCVDRILRDVFGIGQDGIMIEDTCTGDDDTDSP